MGRYIFVIPVFHQWLMQAPLHFISAIVNQAAVARLKESRPPHESDEVSELREAITAEPKYIPKPRDGILFPEFLGLIPTRACNLTCVYCGFGAAIAPKENMDSQMAVAAVDWMAEYVQSLGKEVLDIHFFGGEPSVAWDVVEVAVHRARAVAAQRGLAPHFEIATNGVFNKDRARFIGDYFDTVVLSFDGQQEIHDRHRPMDQNRGSFKVVSRTAHLLSKSPVELCFRICVTQDSVAQLEETVQWFCETFQPSVVNFETLQPTPGSAAAGLQPPDPYEFAIHFIRARQIVEEHGIESVYAADLTDTPRLSFCPVGKDALIVSPEGRVSACYLLDKDWQNRGLDLNLGKLESNGVMQLDLQAIMRVRHLVTEKPRCEGCFCRWSCAGGCHVNYSYPGCSQIYDDFCIQTRIITACSLLKDLGQEQLMGKLLNTQSAMEALAMQKSDCLDDWGETDE